MNTLFKYFLYPLFAIIFTQGIIQADDAGELGTKVEKFPGMYEESVKSILIMPSMNFSTAADAKIVYATTLEIPFAQHGYYVFPYEITSELLKQQGVYETELLYNTPLKKIYEYFGVDAVLFTKIQNWDTGLVTNNISIDAELKSTRTERILWKYNTTVLVNHAGGYGLAEVAAGIFGASFTDYKMVADLVNFHLLRNVPYGFYHPSYLNDQTDNLRSSGIETNKPYRTIGDVLFGN